MLSIPRNMWEKIPTPSILAQVRLQSITSGSGDNTRFLNSSLILLERHFTWMKTANLVDIPPSLGDIPVKLFSFTFHLWHSLSRGLMGRMIYSPAVRRAMPITKNILQYFGTLDNKVVDAQPVVRRQCAPLR